MKKKTRNILIIVVLILIAVSVISVLWVFRKASDNVASEKAAFEAEATNIVDAFTQDETAANAKFLGKVVLVSGTISSFEENEEDKKISVILKGGDAVAGVICEFAIENIDKKILVEGNKIKIKGVCTGFLMDVVLTKCSVED
jgi:DNA/RNA endonuclease YhcR with UshA esterase domain